MPNIADAVANLYLKKYDASVKRMEYVSREVYELFVKKYGEKSTIITFDENSYEVKEVGDC